MALLELIDNKIVKTPLVSDNKIDVIKELLTILVDAGKLTDIDTAVEAILEREDLGSTGLTDGIAIPHAKTNVVDSLTIAIGLSPEGIDFEALDENPSTMFFLILAPPDQSGPHLQALTEIANVVRSKAFCRLLLASTSAEEVVELFKED
ncbi:MAG: PTS sugar transporter subunit IIA [Spirochaetaceae bacterium]